MLLVIKMGGSILKEGASSDLVSDLKELLKENKAVLFHGGGVEVTEIAAKLGKEQKFIVSPEGFRSRYTDKETIEIYTMVMAGKINKQIVLALQSQGIAAVGLSGLDGAILKAERKKKLIAVDERGRKKVMDGGYTGKISKVNADLIQLLLEKGWEKREEDLGKKPIEDLLDILFEELSKGSAVPQGMDMISTLERGLILRALQKTKGNQVQAAQLLGINRGTLRGKMERYHIKKEVLVAEEE